MLNGFLLLTADVAMPPEQMVFEMWEKFWEHWYLPLLLFVLPAVAGLTVLCIVLVRRKKRAAQTVCPPQDAP